MKPEFNPEEIALYKMGDGVKFLAPCLIRNKQLDKNREPA
ncbi:hypothetical protein B566_EDAN008164 [Ephemera danica]|nr:hypothetical protein B566_EDAN008164 [Ephemera danica]